MMDTDSYYQAKDKNGTVTKYSMVEVKKDTPKIDNKFEAGDLVTATKDAPKFYASGEKLTVIEAGYDGDNSYLVENEKALPFLLYGNELAPYTETRKEALAPKFKVGDLVTQKEDVYYGFTAHGEKLTVEGVLADIDINIVKNAYGTVFAYYSKEIEPYTGE